MRKLLLDKRAETSKVVWAFLLIAIIGVGWYIYNNSGANPQEQVQQQILEKESKNCEVEPYLDVAGDDAINPGTATSAGINAVILNGKYDASLVAEGSSGDKYVIGDVLDMIVNASGYISTKVESIDVENCGKNKVSTEMYKLDGAPTIKIFADNTQLTDNSAGGANNVTASSDPIVLDYQFTMPSNEGAKEMYIVIEASNTTEVNEMIVSSSTSGVSVEKAAYNKPDVHAMEGAHSNSLFRTYRIIASDKEMTDGKVIELKINIEPESTVTIGTGNQEVYTTVYFPQDFVDSETGKFVFGIEDSTGTAKHVSAASTDYDFSIGNV